MKCVLLSPERALFEGEVASIQLPAYDGGMGILPGHAPMIGRLGNGLLVLKTPAKEERFLVFDGFYRIAGDAVTVLSADAVPVKEVKGTEAAAELERAKKLPAATDDEYAAKSTALQRAELKRRVAGT